MYATKGEDSLLRKLTVYLNCLSLQAENMLTEKESGEVTETVNDLSQIDDVSHSLLWSKADNARLNKLQADTRKLVETPKSMDLGCKSRDNHKRLEYFVEHELQTDNETL